MRKIKYMLKNDCPINVLIEEGLIEECINKEWNPLLLENAKYYKRNLMEIDTLDTNISKNNLGIKMIGVCLVVDKSTGKPISNKEVYKLQNEVYDLDKYDIRYVPWFEIVCENIYGVQVNSEICEENFKSQEELLDYMLGYYLEKCF